MSKKMTIFLAGGSGFIGRNIIEQLEKKYDIFAPRHKDLDLLDSNAVINYFKKNPVDIVINSAAVGVSRKNQGKVDVAVTGLKIFFNIIRAKKYFKRMIMLGSGAEYNKSKELKHVKESDFDINVPQDEYGIYKYICSKYAEKERFITHLRLFGVFGKYEDFETRFISYAICRALLKLPVVIHQNVRFDYLYIDDFVNILDKIIQKHPTETFINVGVGATMDLKMIAEKVIKEIGVNVDIKIEKKDFGLEYTCNNKRLLKEINGFIFTPIEDSIAKLIVYYKKNLSNLKNVFAIEK